jgi:hypothetical protein
MIANRRSGQPGYESVRMSCFGGLTEAISRRCRSIRGRIIGRWKKRKQTASQVGKRHLAVDPFSQSLQSAPHCLSRAPALTGPCMLLAKARRWAAGATPLHHDVLNFMDSCTQRGTALLQFALNKRVPLNARRKLSQSQQKPRERSPSPPRPRRQSSS